MSTALHPTRTRKALLREVRAGSVYYDAEKRISYVRYPNSSRVVTATMLELLAAGWVHCDNRDTWRLTAAGAEILDAAT